MKVLLAKRGNRGLRSALLSLYKKVLSVTGLFPRPVRYWLDTFISYVLLRFGNADAREVEKALENAVDLLQTDEGRKTFGDYIEFGVGFGRSLAIMHRVAQRRGLEHMRLIGFDSFEGLPPEAKVDDAGYWAPRMFKADDRVARWMLTRAGVDWSRVALVKGWFSDTLTDETVKALRLKKASIVMIDCDMYQSTREALDFCAPLIHDEAVVVFDDWYSGGLDQKNLGEKRAFEEFLSRSNAFVAEPIADYGPTARVFKVSRRKATRPTAGWTWGALATELVPEMSNAVPAVLVIV